MSKIIHLDGEKPDNISQKTWNMLKARFDLIYNDESEKEHGNKKDC